MRVIRLPIEDARGHVLLHNVVDADGRQLLRKGVKLGAKEISTLRDDLELSTIEVAIADPGDVWEDDAALQLARLLETSELIASVGAGGRINLHSVVHGVLYIDETRLFALNQLPGITLATLPPYAIVRPERNENRIATIKIIPYALPTATLDAASELLRNHPLLVLRPLSPRRLALLISGDAAAHVRLVRQFEPPIRKRLLSLNSDIETVETVVEDESVLARAVTHLLANHHGVILAGQTSIMDSDDLPLRALRCIGAEVTVHGAPVDPGNLFALAWRGDQPILCAPGCARSPARNVMDLVLPRLLVGERLTQREIARMSLGGLLEG